MEEQDSSISDSTSSYSRAETALDDTDTLMTTPGRLGLAYSLLNFPSPHQLGQSTGSIRRSKSLRVSAVSDPSVEVSSGAGTSDATAHILQILSREVGIDETDYQPPAKRPRLSHKAVVATHDDMPLKEFSLFLPSKLPAAIPDSTTALREFVFKTTATYIRLWDFSPEMDCVEVRLPILYEDKFSSNAKFLKDFLGVVSKEIPKVKSIHDLYVPKVVLGHVTNLQDILSGIIGMAAVTHLFLPLSSRMDLSDVLNYDFESLAIFLQSLGLAQLTIVSTDEVIGEFTARLSEEVRVLEGCSLRVTYRKEDLDAPGPQYITCLGEEGTGGELIEPAELVRSMNVYNIPKQRRERAPIVKPKGQKQVCHSLRQLVGSGGIWGPEAIYVFV